MPHSNPRSSISRQNLEAYNNQEENPLGKIQGGLPANRQDIIDAYVAANQVHDGIVHPRPIDGQEVIEAHIAALDQRFCSVPEMQNTMLSGAPRGRWEKGNITWSIDTSGLPPQTGPKPPTALIPL